MKPDLLFWLALAIANTASPFVQFEIRGQSVPLLGALLGIVVATIAPLRFATHLNREDEPESWLLSLQRAIRRVIPLVLSATAVATIVRFLAGLARWTTFELTAGSPVQAAASTIMGIVVLVSLLASFSFVPFLAVLRTRAELDASKVPMLQWPSPTPLLLWPFTASLTLVDGLRWRLAPLLILAIAAPFPAMFFPPIAQLVLQVLLQLVTTLALAAIFTYYADREPAILLKTEKDGV